jgi:hypothetical protein
MSNLDDLINSFLGAAKSDLDALPLISSATFPIPVKYMSVAMQSGFTKKDI